jgi:phosphatidate cytidylyltransferase
MLKQRVLTAIVLLALLAAVLGSGSLLAFYLTLAVFFGAAVWEALRLFSVKRALPIAAVAAALLPVLADRAPADWLPLATLCVLVWALRFAPALKIGLPPTEGARGSLFTAIYLLALFGCFIAIAGLFQRSVAFLVSAMAIVWIADIGAYFAGRAFGRRKLAPTISPGKSWEGVAGGLLAVWLLAGVVAVAGSRAIDAAAIAASIAPNAWAMALASTFPARLLHGFGWPLWLLLMAVIVAASVIGDLFESMMKRRAGVKDSSALLPGHGGVLDRIDALIPVMPLVLLISASLT